MCAPPVRGRRWPAPHRFAPETPSFARWRRISISHLHPERSKRGARRAGRAHRKRAVFHTSLGKRRGGFDTHASIRAGDSREPSAGPRGLAATILLAAAGLRVKVIERLGVVGGRTSAIAVRGFKLDLGPTFFLFPRVLEEIFAAAGASLRSEVEMVRLDPVSDCIRRRRRAVCDSEVSRMERKDKQAKRRQHASRASNAPA